MPLGENYPFEFEETRMIILREAARLFAVYGYDGVSMKQIAKAVGIKAPSFYNHYANKEQILTAIFETSTEWLQAYYARVEEEDQFSTCVEETIGKMFTEVELVIDMFPDYAVCIARQHAVHNRQAFDFYYNVFYFPGCKNTAHCIRRGIEKGFISPSVSADAIATLIMDFVSQNMFYRISKLSPTPPTHRDGNYYQQIRDFFIELVRAGL